MNEVTPLPVEPDRIEPVHVGALLGAARVEQGLSAADVSRALKFSVRQVEALEKDDFSELKGSTFLRGFVRSYARFLKLDEVPLLDALQLEIPSAPLEVHEVESMNAAMPQRTLSVSPARMRQWMITFFLCAGVVGLGWWAVQAGWFRTEAKEPTVVSASSPQASQATEVVRENPVNVAQPLSTVMNPGETVASGLRQLDFAFSGTSWVEVRDANQATVLTGRFSDNARQSVQGFPPFQLVIGNASAVKVRYENRAIDLQPYVRAEVARFTLDDNSK